MKHSFIAITDPGCQEFLKQELKVRFEVTASRESFYLAFEETAVKALEVMYKSQCLKYLLLKSSSGSFDSLEDLYEKFSSDVFIDSKSFNSSNSDKDVKLLCERAGSHSFNSQDVMKKLSEKLVNPVVKGEDVKFRVVINDSYFVAGLDISGRDLSKRQHKVFNHPGELKGTVGFSALVFAGIDEKPVLDPVALSGVIPIEAALFHSNVAVNFYNKRFDLEKLGFDLNVGEWLESFDKEISQSKTVYSLDPAFKNLSAQKKNAKIAGVEKSISFSRCNIDYLDVKFHEEKVGAIVTKPLEPSKRIGDKVAIKNTELLFDRASKILDGPLVLLARKPEFLDSCEKKGFELVDEREVWQGEVKYTFLKYKKVV